MGKVREVPGEPSPPAGPCKRRDVAFPARSSPALLSVGLEQVCSSLSVLSGEAGMGPPAALGSCISSRQMCFRNGNGPGPRPPRPAPRPTLKAAVEPSALVCATLAVGGGLGYTLSCSRAQ